MTVRSITQFYDDITELLLVLLVCMENIFKELFLSNISRGVPLDCGCKGRHFSITDQTFLRLFYKKKLTKIIMCWFSTHVYSENFSHISTFWQIHVAKHKIYTFSNIHTATLQRQPCYKQCLSVIKQLFPSHLPSVAKN